MFCRLRRSHRWNIHRRKCLKSTVPAIWGSGNRHTGRTNYSASCGRIPENLQRNPHCLPEYRNCLWRGKALHNPGGFRQENGCRWPGSLLPDRRIRHRRKRGRLSGFSTAGGSIQGGLTAAPPAWGEDKKCPAACR